VVPRRAPFPAPSGAETAILRHLKKYRKRSPKGGLMDWLENIETESVIQEVYSVLEKEGIPHEGVAT